MRAMHSLVAAGVLGLVAVAGLGSRSSQGQSDDVFAFIPDGGRTLLAHVIAAGGSDDQLRAILTGSHATRDEWLADIKSRRDALPALKEFDDQQLLTLADYLSLNMPLADTPAELAGTDWSNRLPRDGRDLAL